MSYEWKCRVRYSETGVDGKLTLPALVNYFQDCSTFHSESLGLGWQHLSSRKKAWMLSSWQIEVNRYPSVGEHITVKTWPHMFKGFLGGRNFLLLDEKEEVLAYANTNWIFVDLNTGHPTKIDQEELEKYQLESPYEMEYAPRKIPFPEGGAKMPEFQINSRHLDTNHHVNNEEYIAMAQEYLPDNFCICSMRAEYKKAALLHDIVIPIVKQETGCCEVALCDESQKPYAVVVFQGISMTDSLKSSK